ncbi:uncharacterized protein [Diabrotica undecimpunctata]|uniref:uncharacterized protein n=1 Tax=Diabrotica undecimpunctata TaxID=50387 RepID=UPI003B63404F
MNEWMFVFPREKANPLLMDGAPIESSAVYYVTGWITKENFIVWFKKFIEFSNTGPQKPVLLILDGHSSHTKSLELLHLARENNVILLCFPPHTTDRLQPLDVSFMAPLAQEVKKWLLNHPGRGDTIYQIGQLVNDAFSRAANVQTALKGFEKTGIYPFNRDVFPDYLFAPSDTTEQPNHNSDQQTSCATTTNTTNNRTERSTFSSGTVPCNDISPELSTSTSCI